MTIIVKENFLLNNIYVNQENENKYLPKNILFYFLFLNHEIENIFFFRL